MILSRPALSDPGTLHQRSILIVWVIPTVSPGVRVTRSNICHCAASRWRKVRRRYTTGVRWRWITARSARHKIQRLWPRMRYMMWRWCTGTGRRSHVQSRVMKITGITRPAVWATVATVRISRWTNRFTFYLHW